MVKDLEFTANLDLQGNEARNIVIETLQSVPGTDSLGKANRLVAYDGHLYISNGNTFVRIGTVEDTYTSAEVDGQIAEAIKGMYKGKGSVPSALYLPSNPAVGDVYDIQSESVYGPPGTNVVWKGSSWDALAGLNDLSVYATKDLVDTQVLRLTSALDAKVDLSVYSSKVSSLESKVSASAGQITALQSIIGNQVSQSEFSSTISSLDTRINTKVTKISTGAGVWNGAVTVNSEGLVVAGRNLEESDIPVLTSEKISDLSAAIKGTRYVESFSTTQSVREIAHRLGVEWPHVTVYDTATRRVVYPEIVWIDANNVRITGTGALGALTVVVSP